MSIKPFIARGIRYILRGVPNKTIQADIQVMNPNQLLKGKKIIVTGGSRGLGFAMAKKFQSEGAEVLITGRNEMQLKKSAEEIGCKYFKYDITEYSTVPQFISSAYEILDGLDILVNNAGISLHETTFFDVTPGTFRKQLATNLEGPFFLTQSFIRYLIDQKKSGSVLFISSETGETADFRPYGFTKGAINSMVKGLAYLFKQNGIRINAVAPGVTASDMTGVAADGNLDAGEYGAGRFYLPEEVAQIACLLISDAMGNVSGQIITCNNAQTVNARWK